MHWIKLVAPAWLVVSPAGQRIHGPRLCKPASDAEGWYEPSGHGAHEPESSPSISKPGSHRQAVVCDEPGGDDELPGHGAHDAWPGDDWNVSAGQAAQDVAPALLEKDPLGQGAHASLPVVFLNEPGAHRTHSPPESANPALHKQSALAVLPVSACELFAVQARHALAAGAGWNVLGGHAVQTVAPATAYDPDSHAVHVMSVSVVVCA